MLMVAGADVFPRGRRLPPIRRWTSADLGIHGSVVAMRAWVTVIATPFYPEWLSNIFLMRHKASS
jgi:hypothetical protein